MSNIFRLCLKIYRFAISVQLLDKQNKKCYNKMAHFLYILYNNTPYIIPNFNKFVEFSSSVAWRKCRASDKISRIYSALKLVIDNSSIFWYNIIVRLREGNETALCGRKQRGFSFPSSPAGNFHFCFLLELKDLDLKLVLDNRPNFMV